MWAAGRISTLIVVDPQVDGFLRAPLEDEKVEAGAFHPGGEVAAGVGVGEHAGERRLGDDHVAVARGSWATGERPRGEDE